MNKHSNISPAVKLAKQLYSECPTPKPSWEQLVSYGATQSVWIEKAEKLMRLADEFAVQK
jgi:hypothetical protein